MTKIRYRKQIRKTLAVVMSASMIMSSISFSSFASEGEGTKENPTVSVVVTEVKDTEAGTDTMTTETEKNWYEQEEHIQESESYYDEYTGHVESVTTGQTTNEGHETITEQVIKNEDGQVLVESTEIEGQEKTIVENTVTDTQTENQKEIGNFTDTETGDQTIVVDPETEIQYGEWETSGAVSGGEWVKDNEKSSDGDPTIIDSESETSKTTEIEFEDPLDDQDITLNLKPNQSDEEKVYISVEDLVNSNIEIPENKSYTDSDGNQVEVVVTEQKNANGDVIGYSVVTTTTNVKNNTSEESYENTTQKDSEVIAPSGYTEGISEPVTIFDDDGNEIGHIVTETKAIKDEGGNIIGYEIIQTTTKTQVENGETMLENEQSSVENTDVSYTLPTRPEESVATDAATGETTRVIVEDLTDGAGNVIGYKSTTVKTDANGKELLKTSETLYGTSTTVKTTTTTNVDNKNQVTTTTTETTVVETKTIQAELEKRETEYTTEKTTVIETTVLTEEDIYQLIETENGTYFLYKGEMYRVEALENHGSVDMDSLNVNMALSPKRSETGDVDETTDLMKMDTFDSGKKQNGYEYQYVGYGLSSAINVKNGDGNSTVTQFALKDSDGNIHYVLCADYSTNAQKGASYNMVNVDDAEYFKNDGDNFNEAPYIRAIAYNGYWGTDSGIGSLDNVKQVLRDAKAKNLIDLSDEEINNITPGEALAATQAALWYYGDSKGTTEMPKNNVTGSVEQDHGGSRDAHDSEKNTVNALYKALINLDPNVVGDNTTELITEDNFASSASIVIKDNVENTDGTTKTDSHGNELYKADLSFTIEMVPSAIKGNLVVTVKDQYGNEIATKIIAGANKENAKTDNQGNAVYTFENLELAEGVELTLNLHGTQTLDQGVYLYTAQVYSNSQTFIGVAEGTRNVNLSVDMKFEVVEAEASVKESSSSQKTYEKDVIVETMTDVVTEERGKTTETNQSETEIDVTTETRVYADVTVIETTETKTQTKREWNSYQKNEYTYEQDPTDPGNGGEEPTDPGNGGNEPVNPGNGGSDDDDNDYNYDRDNSGNHNSNNSGSNTGTSGPGYEVDVLGDSLLIPDEEVPLGNLTLQVLPKTGNSSFAWMLLSVLSGLALAGMSLTEKRRKKED